MIKFNKLDYKILNHFKYVIMALFIMFLSVNTVSAVTAQTYWSLDEGANSINSVIDSETYNICNWINLTGWVEGDDVWWYTNTYAGAVNHNQADFYDIYGSSACIYSDSPFRAERNNTLIVYKNFSSPVKLSQFNVTTLEREYYTVVGNGNLTMYRNGTQVAKANQSTGSSQSAGWLENDTYHYMASPDAGWTLVTVCDANRCENSADYTETIPNYNPPYYLEMGTMTATFSEIEQGFFDNVGYIDFSQNTYTIGDDVEIFYYIPSFTGDSFYQFDIGLYDSDGSLIKWWLDVGMTGSVSYSNLEPDTYTAKLFSGLSSPTTDLIKSTSATMQNGADTLITNKNIYNSSENIYVSGKAYAESTTNNKGYVWLQAQGTSTYNQYSWNIVSPYTYSKTYTLSPGTYTFTLMKYKNYGVCANTIDILSCFYSTGESEQITVNPLINSNGYGNLNISWDNTQGLINSLQGISYTNATYNDSIYIYDNSNNIFATYQSDDYNYNIDILIPNDNSYIGIWRAKIVNSSNLANISWSNISIVSKSMMNYTNDYGVTIDFDQDEGNYGIHGITWYTGSYRGNYTIRLVELRNGLILTEKNYLSNSTQTQIDMIYLDKNFEYYSIQFVDNNLKILKSANFKVLNPSESFDFEQVEDETSLTPAGQKMDVLVLLMGMGLNDTSKLIFGVMMIAITLCIMYLSTHSVFVAIASGSAIFIWMLAISYIPQWVVILVAIVLILKARQGE